ncbi:MAG: hypothetical protein ACREPJ_15315, partial [Rhodanobacteraceae bacterium]
AERSNWPGRRLGVVRGFARYLQSIGIDAEIPPADLLPWRRQRASPYLYMESCASRYGNFAQAGTAVSLKPVRGFRQAGTVAVGNPDAFAMSGGVDEFSEITYEAIAGSGAPQV